MEKGREKLVRAALKKGSADGVGATQKRGEEGGKAYFILHLIIQEGKLPTATKPLIRVERRNISGHQASARDPREIPGRKFPVCRKGGRERGKRKP